MANIDIKNIEFKKPNEEELKVFKRDLFIHNRKLFLVRFLILLAVLVVIIVGQYFGEMQLVYADRSWLAFLRRQLIFIIVFVVLNIISAIPLVYSKITAKDAELHKFTVLKKVKVNESTNRVGGMGIGGFFFSPNEKYKYLMLMDGEDNVTGKAFVSGFREFSTVKEGDEVYVERAPYRDHFRHYYICKVIK